MYQADRSEISTVRVNLGSLDETYLAGFAKSLAILGPILPDHPVSEPTRLPSELRRRAARVGAEAGDGHGLALVVGAHGVAQEEAARVPHLWRRGRNCQEERDIKVVHPLKRWEGGNKQQEGQGEGRE